MLGRSPLFRRRGRQLVIGSMWLMVLWPLAGNAQSRGWTPIGLETGLVAFSLHPDFAAEEALKAWSSGIRAGAMLPLNQTLIISADVAALSLPTKDEPPSDSSAGPPKDAVNGWSASLSTGIRTPEVRLSGRTGVSMGLDGGYAWLGGSRTPVGPGARF